MPVSGTDTQSHLLGTHVFISAQNHVVLTGGLREAAFWVGLRQEIYVAFVNQRSVIPALEHLQLDRSFDPADDATWANRIIVHCAEVLRYCFGTDDLTASRYTELLGYSGQWISAKPLSFTPIFRKPPGPGGVFEEIWLASDAISTGWAHYYLANILLTAHNPSIPRLGPAHRAALRSMDVS